MTTTYFILDIEVVRAGGASVVHEGDLLACARALLGCTRAVCTSMEEDKEHEMNEQMIIM